MSLNTNESELLGNVVQVMQKINDKYTPIDARLKALEEKGVSQTPDVEDRFTALENSITELKAKGGRIKGTNAEDQTNPVEFIKSMIIKHGDKIANYSGGDMFLEKAVGTMSTSNVTGTIPPFFNNRQPVVPGVDFNLRDLFTSYSTNGKLSTIYPRTVVPQGEGSFGRQTESTTKQQLDFDLQNVTLSMDYRAGWTRVTRQLLDGVDYLSNYIPQRLNDAYYTKENLDFYNDINSVAGTAGSTSETLVVSRIISYVSQLRKLGYKPNVILTSWEAWTSLMLTMPSVESGFSTPAIFTTTPDGIARIAGIPFVPHSTVSASRIFVMDTKVVGRADAHALRLAMSENVGTDFVENKIVFRLEAATELEFYDPKGILYGTTS